MDGEKETGFITADNFVTLLRAFIRDSKDEDTVEVGEIRVTLNRVLMAGEQTPDAIEAAALTRIEDYKENNSQSAGLSSAHLWRDLMGAGMYCTLDKVDAALANLVDAGKIEVHSGQVTSYAPKGSGETTKKKP